MLFRSNEILAANCGKTVEQIEKDCDRDYFMSATEARDYGLVDVVVTNNAEIKKK